MWEKIVAFFMSIIAFFAGLFGIAMGQQNNSEYVYKNYAYGSHERQVMDLYLPEENDGEVGLVLLIHGGGWIAGDKDGYEAALKTCCNDLGFAAAAINYRYISEKIDMYDIIDDIDASLAKIKETAASKGITINKVLLTGSSAGAHLSMLYAYSQKDTAPITPVAVVSNCGPTDLSDENFFFEVKAAYAKEMVTGFIKLNGSTVGCVANRTEVCDEEGKVVEKFDAVLTKKGCDKAADFVNFCDAFGIPVLTLTNVKGYEATMCSEKGIAKAAAKLTYAFANATVAKVNVIIGKAYGTAYVAMNSKAIGADITMAWPNAEIGTMDAKLAAKIMYEGQGADVIDEKAAEYAALQTSALSAAKRGYVDQVVEAADTRKYVIGAFEMLFTKSEDRPDKKHGTV